MRIYIINYSTGPHFDEIQAALISALSSHCNVTISRTPKDSGINLVLGANVLAIQGRRVVFPRNTIIFNLEQLGHNSLWDSTFYMDYLLSYPVIDYTQSNIEYLDRNGKKGNCYFLPIRHSAAFDYHIPQRVIKDIDVLIIGAQSSRREVIAKSLQHHGLIVAYATDCWGDVRRNLLSRIKVVLNIRNSNSGLLETTRLVSLISSGVYCISEASNDIGEDAFFSQWIDITAFENLIEHTLKFVESYSASKDYKISEDSPYFFDTFEFRVSSIFENIIGVTESDTKFELKHNIQELLSRGLYISARKRIISSKNSLHVYFIPAIDYILGQHDRIHDVIDSLPLNGKVSVELLTIYSELLNSKWLPEEIKVVMKSIILAVVKDTPRATLIKNEYTIKLLLKFFSDENEVYLFTKIFPNSSHMFEFGIELLRKISVSNVIWDHITTLLHQSDYLSNEIVLHLCAEIFWKIERTSNARDCYRFSSVYHELSYDHYAIVADRLNRFGDYITAQTYFEKAVSKSDFDNFKGAREQANNCYLLSDASFDISKIAFALERNTSTKVFVKPGSFKNSPTVYVGGISSAPMTCPVLDGDVRIYDRKITNLKGSPAKALGIIACYNEIDIIEKAIRSMIDNNLEVYVIDNWSNDGTYELLEILSNEIKFGLERFPFDGPSEVYDWTGLLARKEEIALSYPGYWIVHGDADEIRTSPWNNVDLATAFQIADNYGSNAIDYIILNFRPVDEGFTAGVDPENYFQFFEIASASDLKYQVKTWKQGKTRVDLVGRGGHFVQFEGRKVFPYKFICKHYPLRSIKHAGKKINFDRMARFSVEERARGWHSHYDNIIASDIQKNWKTLYRWNIDTLRLLAPYLVQGV